MKHYFWLVAGAAILAVAMFPLFVFMFVGPETAALVIKYAERDAVSIASHITEMYSLDRRIQGHSTLPDDLQQNLDLAKEVFHLYKLKVFGRNGLTIYSTDKDDIGTVNEHDYFHNVIAQGRIYSKEVKKDRKTLEGQQVPFSVIETYVPIMQGGNFVGAFEIYMDATPVRTDLKEGTGKLKTISFAMMGFLLLVILLATEVTRRNMRKREEAEARTEQAMRDWEDTFNTITDIITIHDTKFNIVKSNAAAKNSLALPSFLTDTKCFEHYHGTDCPPDGCPSCKSLETGKPARFEMFEPHLGKYIELRAIPRFDENHNIAGLIHIARDITHPKRLEEDLKRLTLTDSLTGLYNRRGLFTLAEQQLNYAQRGEGRLYLLYLDMDNLKRINDEQGHEAGDEAIKDLADVLRRTFRKSDVLARLGGDEFTALMVCKDCENIEDIKQRLQESLDAFNAREGRPYNIEVSTGIVCWDPGTQGLPGEDIEELLRKADALMYVEKQQKKARRAS